MKKLSIALLLASTLSACGGGGGTGSVSTPISVTSANLQLTVSAPTYAAGSPQLDAFNAINAYRKMLGLGLWSQNAALDRSALAHVSYTLTTKIAESVHLEDSSQPGFTGVNYFDRDAAAGYKGTAVTEVMDLSNGSHAIDQFMNTVYHRHALMDQTATEMGIGIVPFEGSNDNDIEIGYTTSQNNASDFVAIYPVDKQTGVYACMEHEQPNPYPSSEAAYTAQFASTNPSYSCLGVPGMPSSNISIQVAAGATLGVTSFTVTEAGQATPLGAWLMANGTTFDGTTLDPTWSVLTAKGAFKLNTTYNVAFVGTVNGKALTKQWSFTTGAVEQL